jgi:excisionase family DNA binding protein
MGRGSQVILRDMPGVLHVFIGAPLPVRVERVARQYALPPEEAAWLVAANDRERAAYLRAEHGVEWPAPDLYDLMISTGRLPTAAAVATIVAAARAMETVARGEARYRRVRQDHYTVKEAAEVLLLPAEVIRHAVYAGELPAERAGKAIVSIRRQDLLRWLAGETAPAPA